MFLTHSVMGWIVLAVLSLCLPVWSTAKVTQPYRVLSTNGTAQIQCVIHPRPAFLQIQASSVHSSTTQHYNSVDLRVALLKGLHGNQKLCSSMLSIPEKKVTEEEKDGEVQCSALIVGGAVEVTVTSLKDADTDIYRCDIEVHYPPPFLRLIGNGTLVHVAASTDSPRCPAQTAQRQQREGEREDDEDEEEDDGKAALTSVPVVALVIAIICVLILIVCFQTLQCDQGRRKVVWTLPPSEHHKVDAVSILSEKIV